MVVVQTDIIHYEEVFVRLSCGASIWFEVEANTVINDEFVVNHLINRIKHVSLYDKEFELDVFENDKSYQGRWKKLFSIDATKSLYDIIKKYNEGGVGMIHSIGTSDKEAIKLIIKEIL